MKDDAFVVEQEIEDAIKKTMNDIGHRLTKLIEQEVKNKIYEKLGVEDNGWNNIKLVNGGRLYHLIHENEQLNSHVEETVTKLETEIFKHTHEFTDKQMKDMKQEIRITIRRTTERRIKETLVKDLVETAYEYAKDSIMSDATMQGLAELDRFLKI